MSITVPADDVSTCESFELRKAARWRRYFAVFLWALLALTLLADFSQAQTITQQITDQNVMAGQVATFTLSFSNGPCSAVWYTSWGNEYNVPYSSPSPITFTTPVTTTSMSGDFAEAVLFNCAGGSATPLSSVAHLTVTPSVPLSSISIAPSAVSLTVGSTAQVTATGSYPDSSTYNLNSTAIWTSDTPSVASVDSHGIVTGLAAGTANVSALSGGFTASTQVTVSLATANLVINAPSIAVFDDNTPILPGPVEISEIMNPTTTPVSISVGTIVSDSTGHLSGSLQINPNSQFVDANGNVDLTFGLPLFPNVFTYPVPVAEFEQGASGLTLQLVLYRKALVVKSQMIAMTP